MTSQGGLEPTARDEVANEEASQYVTWRQNDVIQLARESALGQFREEIDDAVPPFAGHTQLLKHVVVSFGGSIQCVTQRLCFRLPQADLVSEIRHCLWHCTQVYVYIWRHWLVILIIIRIKACSCLLCVVQIHETTVYINGDVLKNTTLQQNPCAI